MALTDEELQAKVDEIVKDIRADIAGGVLPSAEEVNKRWEERRERLGEILIIGLYWHDPREHDILLQYIVRMR